MTAKIFNFQVSFRVIHCSDASTQTPLNLKTDRNEFKMFYEKECNILIKPHWLLVIGNISLETCKSYKHSFVYRILQLSWSNVIFMSLNLQRHGDIF